MFVFVMFSSSLAYLDVPVTPLSGDQRRSSLERSTSLHNSFPNSPQRSSPQMMVQTSMGPVEPSKSSPAWPPTIEIHLTMYNNTTKVTVAKIALWFA